MTRYLVLWKANAADGGALGKKLVREAIFGPAWELGGLNPLSAAEQMALLARLAAGIAAIENGPAFCWLRRRL